MKLALPEPNGVGGATRSADTNAAAYLFKAAALADGSALPEKAAADAVLRESEAAAAAASAIDRFTSGLNTTAEVPATGDRSMPDRYIDAASAGPRTAARTVGLAMGPLLGRAEPQLCFCCSRGAGTSACGAVLGTKAE